MLKVSEITLSLELSNISILCGHNFLVLLTFLVAVVEHGPRLFFHPQLALEKVVVDSG